MRFDVGSLFVSLIISTVGFGIFRYGKKNDRLPQIIAGLAMMIYPYFIGSVLWMSVVALAIVGALWLAIKAGL